MTSPGRVSYPDFPGFSRIYLEDSYVLNIQQSSDTLKFLLDMVLLEGHPLYRPPPPDEQYCYRNAWLILRWIDDVHWLELSFTPTRDATGTVDFGNIDAFYLEEGRYYLEGTWGIVTLRSSPPTIEFDE